MYMYIYIYILIYIYIYIYVCTYTYYIYIYSRTRGKVALDETGAPYNRVGDRPTDDVVESGQKKEKRKVTSVMTAVSTRK